MKPLKIQKRRKKWLKACKKRWLPIIQTSRAYRDYIHGRLELSYAIELYARAVKRHTKTNYDELWRETTKERIEKAKRLSANGISFATALERVNEVYKPHLRLMAA
jgi:hypothetical protein